MSFFLRRVHNHEEAEDLTQEVFARLLSQSESTDAPADAYVFQVAMNLVRDGVRRRRVRESYLALAAPLEDVAVEALDPARISLGIDALASLASELQGLPERTRDIFILYRVEDISMDLIAESYGISKSAVKKHVSKAMTALMARMRERR